MGNCLGFHHTDYMDRSFSCGGAYDNEGEGSIGANHLPGTPTSADNKSWILACSDGTDRPFNVMTKKLQIICINSSFNQRKGYSN